MNKRQKDFLAKHVAGQTLNRFVAQEIHGEREEDAERAFLQPLIDGGYIEAVNTRRLHWPEAWAGTKLTGH